MTIRKSRMMLLSILLLSNPSYAMMWGTGMWGGNQACGYEIQESEEATSLKEEIAERNKELREAKAELRRLKSRSSSIKSSLNAKKDLVKLTGFEGDAFSMIENHITIGRKCEDYHKIECPPVTMVYRSNRMPASGPENDAILNPRDRRARPLPPPAEIPSDITPPPVADSPDSLPPVVPPIVRDPTPRAPSPNPSPRPNVPQPASNGSNSGMSNSAPTQVGIGGTPTAETCGSGNLISTHPFKASEWTRHCGPGAGEVRESICSVHIPDNRPRTYNADTCKRHIKDWVDKQKELRENEIKIAELELKVKELEAIVKVNRIELREAQKEWLREMREKQSEGECVDCLIISGSVYTPRKASGWEIAANVALGIGSMYLGNQLNKYAINSNAKLGFPTQPYPAFGYGFPYFMGALYGAIGGSLGGGAFGCFGGMGPFGMGGVYGPMGGVFGYPPGIWGVPMSGGIFLPGMGGFGIPGPWGVAMCVTWPCPIGGGMGMMVGGGIGMMMPGMMAPGMMVGGGIGMMMPGMMAPGMMVGGGIGMMMPGMGMMMPGMGMMVGGGIGMMMPGMGMMMGDMGYMQMQMQMQQQMMQMQMQAYQQAMQMQQQRIQQQMAQQRVIAGLTQELYTLMFRLQQAQMGMYTSGYSPIILPSFPSNPGWGVTPQPYPAPGVPIPPNVPGGANPGNGGPPRFR